MYNHFLIQYQDVYPQMSQLNIIATAIPVTFVPCERGFSAANRTKINSETQLSIPSVCRQMMISNEGQPLSEFDFRQPLAKFKKQKYQRIFGQ